MEENEKHIVSKLLFGIAGASVGASLLSCTAGYGFSIPLAGEENPEWADDIVLASEAMAVFFYALSVPLAVAACYFKRLEDSLNERSEESHIEIESLGL